ncbi:MAG TPA: hypothetical protein VGN63_09340 [Flavisolibacter sp.]|jgi:hypothetical protein|nr:hypothetical protein [Flavisolibacter sp.]
MANDREYNLPHQPGNENADNRERDPKEQFNELSELSLEERMAVADRIGIPVDNVGEAAATGAMRGDDNATAGSGDPMDEENTGEGMDR